MTEGASASRLGALAHRNFRLFFVGQGVSLIGTWMQSVALGWLVLEITNSPFAVGLNQALRSLGVLVFALYAGVVVDRVDKRRLIVWTQVLQMVEALALALLVWTKSIATWQVMVLALGFGVVNAFDIPGRQAFIVELVGKDDLMNAIALNSSMFNAARIAGPAVAGVLIGAAGVGMCFFLNGGAAFAALLVAFAAARSFATALLLLALAGCAMIVTTALANTMLQTLVPDELRGRVMAFYAFVFVGMAPLGAFLAGLLAEHTSAPLAVGVGGAGCLIAILLTAWLAPALRKA